jgi:hypothetical protein
MLKGIGVGLGPVFYCLRQNSDRIWYHIPCYAFARFFHIEVDVDFETPLNTSPLQFTLK